MTPRDPDSTVGEKEKGGAENEKQRREEEWSREEGME
jgi:hypothetical protein